MRVFLIMLMLSAFVSGAWAVNTPSLVVSARVTKDGKFDATATDLLSAKLSENPLFDVVEREDLTLLFHEEHFSREGFVDASKSSSTLRLFGVEVRISLALFEHDRAKLSLVHAGSSRLIGEEILSGGVITDVVSQAAKRSESLLLESVVLPDGEHLDRASTLAIQLDNFSPQISQSDLSQLKSALQGRGFDIVERVESNAIRKEHELIQGGFAKPQSRDEEFAPLLGARYLLNIDPTQGEASLIDTAFGARRGTYELPKAIDVEALASWVSQKASNRRGSDTTSSAVRSAQNHPEIEELFFRAVRHYSQERYIEAFTTFLAVGHLQKSNNHIRSWACHSLSGAGFTSLATSWEWCSDGKEHNVGHKERGAIFAGVAEKVGVTSADTRLVTLLLSDALSHTSSPIGFSEDITALRDEFDTLVGVKSTANIVKSPPSFIDGAITLVGSLERREDSSLTFVLHSGAEKSATITLSRDRGEWKKAISEFVLHLDENLRDVGAIQGGAPDEDSKELWNKLHREYDAEGSNISSPILPLKILRQEPAKVSLIPYVTFKELSSAENIMFRRVLYESAVAALPKADSDRIAILKLLQGEGVIQLRSSPWRPALFAQELQDKAPIEPPLENSEPKSGCMGLSIEGAHRDPLPVLRCAEKKERKTPEDLRYLFSAFYALSEGKQIGASLDALEVLANALDENGELVDPEISANALYQKAEILDGENNLIEAFDAAKKGYEQVKGKRYRLLAWNGDFISPRSLESYFVDLLELLRKDRRGSGGAP